MVAARNTHILSISAPVTRLQWRPPSRSAQSLLESEQIDNSDDHFDAMLAAATAPVSGANARGSGSVALWSLHRPFMPLSIVEGHQEGAVTDFLWVDTPAPDVSEKQSKSHTSSASKSDSSFDTLEGTWQHVITVGRDGESYFFISTQNA